MGPQEHPEPSAACGQTQPGSESPQLERKISPKADSSGGVEAQSEELGTLQEAGPEVGLGREEEASQEGQGRGRGPDWGKAKARGAGTTQTVSHHRGPPVLYW